ncbi:hypothetical protein [Actinopolymorpha pittospori]|uniref:hypothetical protein n=1 Tax=Actinopolymorpha pittospori TaxID=648752 RepID=UPI00178B1F7B|nr:hypothetical protein [Actinopolymorpha pittospori]
MARRRHERSELRRPCHRIGTGLTRGLQLVVIDLRAQEYCQEIFETSTPAAHR